ncbi:MAG TPA: aminoacyl-tRNA hydrolase [Anaerolineaceae bacterium]|nr:aminoacyl-tRNA hydrolase [Anaerolineaceae bacterium]
MSDAIFKSIQRAQELFRKREKPAGESPESTAEPYLLVGLGNPGREYRNNRHNVGFMVLDAIAEKQGIPLTRVQSKAIIGTGAVEGHRLVLAKPQTYMNLSGDAIAALVRFYKVPREKLLIIYDDLDLPFGVIRMRPGGGAGGQKGVASTINRLGSPDFPRLRIGIDRPPGQMDARGYVIQDFPTRDQEMLRTVIDRGVEAALTFVCEGLDQAMNKFNGPVKG